MSFQLERFAFTSTVIFFVRSLWTKLRSTPTRPTRSGRSGWSATIWAGTGSGGQDGTVQPQVHVRLVHLDRRSSRSLGSCRTRVVLDRHPAAALSVFAFALGAILLGPKTWRLLRLRQRVRRARMGRASVADATLLYHRFGDVSVLQRLRQAALVYAHRVRALAPQSGDRRACRPIRRLTRSWAILGESRGRAQTVFAARRIEACHLLNPGQVGANGCAGVALCSRVVEDKTRPISRLEGIEKALGIARAPTPEVPAPAPLRRYTRSRPAAAVRGTASLRDKARSGLGQPDRRGHVHFVRCVRFQVRCGQQFDRAGRSRRAGVLAGLVALIIADRVWRGGQKTYATGISRIGHRHPVPLVPTRRSVSITSSTLLWPLR